MRISKAKRKRLKKKMGDNWGEELSNRTGFSKSYIYKVLDGERFNEKVINEAIALGNERTEPIKKLEEKIDLI